MPIDASIGNTFAMCLRAILRQDPDKILVGEIRDIETAEIAVQASLTGHTVFSTLHTNDAPSTITRLRDMGIQSFLITATVEGILAQRLVRRICTQCRETTVPSSETLTDLDLTPSDIAGKSFFRGRGCDACNNTGYKGRVGLFELMIMNNNLRDMIMQRRLDRRTSRRGPRLWHGHLARRRHAGRRGRLHHARRSRPRNGHGRLTLWPGSVSPEKHNL